MRLVETTPSESLPGLPESLRERERIACGERRDQEELLPELRPELLRELVASCDALLSGVPGSCSTRDDDERNTTAARSLESMIGAPQHGDRGPAVRITRARSWRAARGCYKTANVRVPVIRHPQALNTPEMTNAADENL